MEKHLRLSLKQLVSIHKGLEKAFCRHRTIPTAGSILSQAKLQMATSMRRNKTDISDAHELAKSHFKAERIRDLRTRRIF